MNQYQLQQPDQLQPFIHQSQQQNNNINGQGLQQQQQYYHQQQQYQQYLLNQKQQQQQQNMKLSNAAITKNSENLYAQQQKYNNSIQQQQQQFNEQFEQQLFQPYIQQQQQQQQLQLKNNNNNNFSIHNLSTRETNMQNSEEEEEDDDEDIFFQQQGQKQPCANQVQNQNNFSNVMDNFIKQEEEQEIKSFEQEVQKYENNKFFQEQYSQYLTVNPQQSTLKLDQQQLINQQQSFQSLSNMEQQQKYQETQQNYQMNLQFENKSLLELENFLKSTSIDTFQQQEQFNQQQQSQFQLQNNQNQQQQQQVLLVDDYNQQQPIQAKQEYVSEISSPKNFRNSLTSTQPDIQSCLKMIKVEDKNSQQVYSKSMSRCSIELDTILNNSESCQNSMQSPLSKQDKKRRHTMKLAHKNQENIKRNQILFQKQQSLPVYERIEQIQQQQKLFQQCQQQQKQQQQGKKYISQPNIMINNNNNEIINNNNDQIQQQQQYASQQKKIKNSVQIYKNTKKRTSMNQISSVQMDINTEKESITPNETKNIIKNIHFMIKTYYKDNKDTAFFQDLLKKCIVKESDFFAYVSLKKKIISRADFRNFFFQNYDNIMDPNLKINLEELRNEKERLEIKRLRKTCSNYQQKFGNNSQILNSHLNAVCCEDFEEGYDADQYDLDLFSRIQKCCRILASKFLNQESIPYLFARKQKLQKSKQLSYARFIRAFAHAVANPTYPLSFIHSKNNF